MPPRSTPDHSIKFDRAQANGVEFHVAMAGPIDGPLVVLLHGFPEFWFAWRHQIAPLAAAGYRVVAPDQRGYGLTTKPPVIGDYLLDTLAKDVVALAASLGHEHFSLVGHDWGGIVAWQLAARFPENVERTVILNAPHPGTLLSHAFWHPFQFVRSAYVGFFQVPGLPELVLKAGDHALLANTLTRSSLPGTFSADELDSYREAWSQKGALTAMLNWYRAMPAAKPCHARIQSPLRVIWGDKDTALDQGLAERGAAMCEDAEVIHVKGATHWVHQEEPELVSRLLLEFLHR